MNTTSQTSRRSFVGTLLLLAGGTALGSVTHTLPAAEKRTTGLTQQWALFCERHKGRPFDGMFQPAADITEPIPCPGHIYATGRVIYFAAEDVLAEPVWIYWGTDNTKPADVIITFFRNDAEKNKLIRLNRFELEALTLYATGEDLLHEILLMREPLQGRALPQGAKTLAIKTVVGKEPHWYLPAIRRPETISIERKYIYNT